MLRQRKFWFLLAFIEVLVAGATLAWIFLRQPIGKAQAFEHLQQSFNDIPVYTEAKLIYQRYYGCTKCRYGGMMALYATDVSPAEVCAFYWNFILNSEWDYMGGLKGDNKVCQWGLSAKKHFTNSLQEESFNVLTAESENTSELWYTPHEATRKAISIGKTVYIVSIFYTQNKEVLRSECPPSVLGICEKDWWEIDNP